MKDYVIFTDSSCDLPRNLVEAWGLEVLSLEVNIEGVGTFLNHEIEPVTFYGYLRDKREGGQGHSVYRILHRPFRNLHRG